MGALLFAVLLEFERNFEGRKERPLVCFAFFFFFLFLTYAQLSFEDFG